MHRGPIRGGRLFRPHPLQISELVLRIQSMHTFTRYVPCPSKAEDEIVARVNQPYAEDASPTAQSPDYVLESNPEADPEEDDDEDPRRTLQNYPVDGVNNSDDQEGHQRMNEDDYDIEARR
ncbi:hypothetical protein Tco_0671918 [Tanacetum coccineum]